MENASKTNQLLREAKQRLSLAYRDRLAGVLLYGSTAREEDTPESDIDLLILLKGPIDIGAETRRIVDALYDLQLGTERPIHVVPADVDSYHAGRCSFYRMAQEQGQPV